MQRPVINGALTIVLTRLMKAKWLAKSCLGCIVELIAVILQFSGILCIIDRGLQGCAEQLLDVRFDNFRVTEAYVVLLEEVWAHDDEVGTGALGNAPVAFQSMNRLRKLSTTLVRQLVLAEGKSLQGLPLFF